ncbi:non-ribosomal peptide synthetase [Roseateles sp.]|uniref:non-ribosomal peptide synthetase n=1 Tax=Roseateles sp. TaxID=1971397 RepID=UPI003BA5D437
MASREQTNLESAKKIPLSLSQREVWLDQRAWPNSAHLNIGGAVSLNGPLDLARLRHALRILIERHETLRLALLPDGEQVLLQPFEPQLPLIELEQPAQASLEAARAQWRERLRTPFKLDGGPLWRFELLRYGPDLHDLSIQFHHLIMDGWGTTLILRAWAEIYDSLAHPGPYVSESVPKPSYVDFIAESNEYKQSAAYLRDAEFWRGHIGNLPEAAPTRRSSNTPKEGLPIASVTRFSIARAAYEDFSHSSKSLGLGPFNCLLAALALYLSRANGLDSLLIGVPSLNRSGRRFLTTPGMFAGVLPVRINVDRTNTVTELLRHVALQMQSALRHARFPFSDVMVQQNLLRSGRDSLIDVLLSFERQDYDFAFGEAHLCEPCQLFAGQARYPLAITLCEFGANIDTAMVLEASKDCFSASEAVLLGQRIWHLAQTMLTDPQLQLDRLDIVPPEERWALLEGPHKDLAQLESPQPYIDLFLHQAALWPERCALVWDHGQMSYGELARRAERLASQLRGLGAARNKVVALALERSPEMVVAILAIARAGAAFLPLDPQAPLARLAGVLLDSAAVALLLAPSATPELQNLHQRCLRLSLDLLGADGDAEPSPHDAPALWSWAKAGADDLAYVLFTSGSSGRPKGVMVEHGALSRRLAWLSRTWAIDANDRSAQGTQLSFDPAMIELLLPLTQGASIALPTPGRLHPAKLAEFILRHGATFSALVPSALPGLLAGWRGAAATTMAKSGCTLKLRVACCGGEVLAPALAERFVRETGARLYNVYGPTEAIIFASAWPVSAQLMPVSEPVIALEDAPRSANSTGAPLMAAEANPDLPIGYPVDDTRIYVLSPELQVQPHGVIGDIFIGGNALARGYLGRADLDAHAFFPDPFQTSTDPQAPARMYRSGDRGWWDTQGRLHFSGRADRQVKLRGYRIELGDVEAACLAQTGVQQALVQLIRVEGQAPALHAWLGGASLDPTTLQAGLRLRLPDYMRPSRLICLPELPLTTNGKIDLKALPQLNGPVQPRPGEAIQAPTTAMEKTLHALWRQALSPALQADTTKPGVPLGVNVNFFDLGGDSLAALSILGAMEEQLGRHLPLHLMAEHPSIAELASALSQPIARPGIVQPLGGASLDEVGPAASQTSVFLVASGLGDILRLQNLAQSLQGDARLFMLQAPLEPPPAKMKDFASLYADAIEAQAPGNVWLAGFSVGGVTALETARELQRRGRPPLGLMLLDTIHPEAVFGGAASWRTLGWLVRKLHMQELSMNGRRLSAMFSDPGLISQVMALRGHHCQAFDGPVLLLKSSGLAGWNRLLFQAWHRLLPDRLRTCVVTGLHGSIFEPSHVDELADAMRQFMLEPSKQAPA